MTPLNLHESTLLLGLDDENGKFTAESTYHSYGLAAAVITDLILAERIAIEDDRIVIRTNALTDDKLLNDVLRRLQEQKKPPKVTNWIHHLVMRMGKLRPLAIEQLIRRGILERKEEKILWVFNVDRYPSRDVTPENRLRTRLHRILFEAAEPDTRERLLLGIILASHLLPELAPTKAMRKEAKARIEALTADEEMNRLLGRSIQEMQTAVMVSTTAATM